VEAGDYSVEILPSAKRELAKLAPPTRRRVARTVDRLAREPKPHGARLLSGSGDRPIWRVRVGTYRILYEIRDHRMVVLVIRVAHRRDVYR
jgi:mRNA interferase RelE/StbE